MNSTVNYPILEQCKADSKYLLIRLSSDNLFQLGLINRENPEDITLLTPPLKHLKVNKVGKQLAQDYQIPYKKSLKKTFPQLAQQQKEKRRQQWREEQQKRWEQWQSHFKSQAVSEVTAIYLMNRWIKQLGEITTLYLHRDYAFGDQERLVKIYADGRDQTCVDFAYQIKDEWLKRNEEYLIIAKKVRRENKGWLYEYLYQIESSEWKFHGYFEPSSISEEKGEDLPPFTTSPLSPDEIKKIQQQCEVKSVYHFVAMLGWHFLGKRGF